MTTSSQHESGRESSGNGLMASLRKGNVAATPWIPALVGCILLFVVIMIASSSKSLGVIGSSATVASFAAVVAFGQMLVITGGEGAIDLSIPTVITVSSFLMTVVANGSNGRLVYAVVIVLAVAALVGAVNGIVSVYLKIPAIVTTLAMSFILTSAYTVISGSVGSGAVSPIVSGMARVEVGGVTLYSLIAVLFAVGVWIVVARCGYGWRLSATGQSTKAAVGAGLRPGRARFAALVASSLLAAVVGMLLTGYEGGPSLDMGTTYLVASISAVVIGGTLVAGGRPSTVGCLIGAMFVSLLVTLTNVVNISAGGRDAVEGCVIIGVLAIGGHAAGDRSSRRRFINRRRTTNESQTPVGCAFRGSNMLSRSRNRRMR
jgi:ribose transport system permease protein